MSTELKFVYPELPVSVNKLYMVRGGRKVLTSQGRKFKNAFISSRGGLSATKLLAFVPDPEAEYVLDLWFFIKPERLYNLTYGTDGRVKSPYSDMDTSNLVKLAEDCIAKLVGLRDRNNFDVLSHKREARDGQERIVAVIKPSPMEDCPYESH